MKEQEIINKEEKEDFSTPVQNDDSKNKNEDAYFIIIIPREEKIDFVGLNYQTQNKINPIIIYKKTIEKEDKTYIEEIVFKFKKSPKNKEKYEGKKKSNESTKYKIQLIEGEHTYNITFSLKDDCFVYQPELKKGNKYLENPLREIIDQNIVPLYNKLDIFIEALKKDNESYKKEEKLYEDTINLYEDKKQFSLLVTLFLKIYKEKKDLCSKLLKIFSRINSEENTDKFNDLKKEVKTFKEIFSNARDIMKENNYNPIHFYGFLFCYLHYYDKENFPKMIEQFYEENADILYEILIQYYSHFFNPLKQSQKFYNGFVQYALKKEMKLKYFKRILEYIEDIETFLFVINSNKREILKNYEELRSDPIKISGNLKLVKYSVNNIEKRENNNFRVKSKESSDDDNESDEDNIKSVNKLKNIEKEFDKINELIMEIIEYSKKERILVIYLKSTFWINLVKEYNYPNLENIRNVHILRDLFKNYNELINDLYEENKKSQEYKNNKDDIYYNIKNDINRYYGRDEFAFILNKNINNFIENDKERLTNAEILGTVVYFNPYFSIRDKIDKERYKYNRQTYIFDYINFDKITETFIKTFRNLNFETVFEENIVDYINKITGKIKNIQTFGNIIKLVNVEEIKYDKQKEYYLILEEKYKLFVKDNIKLIKEEKELNKGIKIIAEFISKIFLFENNNRFLDEEISLLENNIKSLIYLELISTYNEEKYKNQKNHIYEIYLEKCSTKEGRDNIIELIRKLKYDDKKYFIYEKLLQKCDFTKEEFFSNQENYKIQTLCLLNKELLKESQKENEQDKKRELKLNILAPAHQGNIYAENLVKTLDNILSDLERGNITKKDLQRFLNIKNEKVWEEGDEKEQEKDKNESKQINCEIDHDQYVKDKLLLITLIIENYDPIAKYAEYKKNIEYINEQIKKLKFIKDSLMIYHRNIYIGQINEITNILYEIENSPIYKFKFDQTRESIKNLLIYLPICSEINNVKDFLLFQKLFENIQGRDQSERFDEAYKKLKELKILFSEKGDIEKIFNHLNYRDIFNNIKNELENKSEFQSKKFMDQMIEYFEIKDNKIKKELKMIINSKKYEKIVKSIKYFFDNFSNKKLTSLENMNINLSEMNYSILLKTLNQLKSDGIFDYELNSHCYSVFTYFYEKKEAIDFLKSKLETNLQEFEKKLKNNLDKTNRSISIEDIEDTIECLKKFKPLLDYDAKEILKYITLLDEVSITKFENFSKKYGSIIELDRKKGKDNFKAL